MMVNGKYEYHRMGIGTSAGMQAAEHLHALLVHFHSLNCYYCYFVFIIAIINFCRELFTWHTVTNVTGRGDLS